MARNKHLFSGRNSSETTENMQNLIIFSRHGKAQLHLQEFWDTSGCAQQSDTLAVVSWQCSWKVGATGTQHACRLYVWHPKVRSSQGRFNQLNEKQSVWTGRGEPNHSCSKTVCKMFRKRVIVRGSLQDQPFHLTVPVQGSGSCSP